MEMLLRAVRQGERPDVARRDDRFGTFADLGVARAEEQRTVFSGDVGIVGDQRGFRQVVLVAQMPGQDRQHRVTGLFPESAVVIEVVQPEGEGGPMTDHRRSSPTSASMPSLLRR